MERRDDAASSHTPAPARRPIASSSARRNFPRVPSSLSAASITARIWPTTSTTPEPSRARSRRRCWGFRRSPFRSRWITSSRWHGVIGRAPRRSCGAALRQAFDALQRCERYWNLNVPNLPLEQIAGIAVTRLGRKRICGRMVGQERRRRNALLSRVGVAVRNRSRNARHRHRRRARGLRQPDAADARSHRESALDALTSVRSRLR